MCKMNADEFLYAAKLGISLFSQYHTMFLLRKNNKEITNFLKYAEKLSFGLEFEFFLDF